VSGAQIQPDRPACRMCGAALEVTFVDLGMSPPCESYLTAAQLDGPETFLPLHVRICSACLLVQLPAYLGSAEIFSEYAYFSSYSDSWVQHAGDYVDARLSAGDISGGSFVVEVASNDGYLLQHVVKAGIRALGIEPAANVADAAIERGIPTEVAFLGETSARDVVARHGAADLVVANNVFAHVPDQHDFTAGLATLLAPDGLLTVEVPHLLQLIEQVQFDTIYHEHFSYWSLHTARQMFAAHGLDVVAVEELATHGGSLRYHVRHASRDLARRPVDGSVDRVLERERRAGLDTLAGHLRFAEAAEANRHALLTFLLETRASGLTIAGYGAPGKGNTLLNYCGVRADLLPYLVDRNPYKQGRFAPGTHIPILAPDVLAERRPDLILILPWNLRPEITAQLAYTRDWGARLVVPVPQVEVF
jgi:SAM-dependent methyltransferase